MNTETFLVECGALTIEIFLTYLTYKLYKTNANCLQSLKEVQCFELDNELHKKVQEKNGVVQYAAISGNVKAVSLPLRSQYLPYLQGVIRERITREHKVRWSPFLRIWSSANHNIQHTTNYVPFALCSKMGGLFKKQVSVEVVEPLLGQELVLLAVYDEFTSHQDTIGDAVFGFFRGERTIGLQEIERMLCENESLTVVGKLVFENNKLQVKPPDKGLTYFVTPLTLESLTNKINASTRVFKVATIVLSAATVALAAYVLRHAFSEVKRKLIRSRELKRLEEQRRSRRMADESRKEQNVNIPKCVVCLEFPVEVLILECGHACLCYSCSEHVKRQCPVCREPIVRTVPTFWP